MEFAGNKYAYISKNKIDNLHTLNKNTGEKKVLKRELSVERIKDKELDIVYSDDDEMMDTIISKNSNDNQKSNFTTNTLSNTSNKKFSKNIIIPSNINNNQNQNVIGIPIKPVPKTYTISNDLLQNNVEYEKEVDSNVLTIRFGFLKEKVGYATGDPFICKTCEAYFNQHSRLNPIENSEKSIWECEFCSFNNEIMIESEEIPKSDCIDYFVQSKSQNDKNFKNSNYNDDEKVIFTFDTSGSMCFPVTGSVTHILPLVSKVNMTFSSSL